MRLRTNIALKERKTLALGGFKGVDFSSSPLEVSPHRATDMVNLINEYGTNRKRNGWCELFRIETAARGGRRINGIFKYNDHLIVHAGVRFFKVIRFGEEYESIDITESGTYEPSRVDISKLVDARSEAYLLKKRLYIIGAGDFLVYGTWDDGKTYELRRVANDEDTYIPTTTININCDAEAENDVRGTLDEPNLLCDRRINSLVGTKTSNSTWTLDSIIEAGSEVKVRVELYDEDGNKLPEKVYVNGYRQIKDVNDKLEGVDTVVEEVKGSETLYLYRDEPYGEEEAVEEGGRINFEEGKITLSFATSTFSNMDNIYVTFVSKRTKSLKRVIRVTGTYNDYVLKLPSPIKEGSTVEMEYRGDVYRNYVPVIVNGKEELFGFGGTNLYRKNEVYIDKRVFGSIDFSAGELHLTFETQGSSNTGLWDENNVKISYFLEGDIDEAEDGKEAPITAEDIERCTFGTLFGTYGNTNRLFVSGNGERPNMDFYSAAEDFTYFSDLQSSRLGSEASAISGYARLSDSTLIIYKTETDREASTYYRTGKNREEYDEEGNVIDGEAIFPLTAGSIGESVVSRQACVNFAGDTLMLSKNGVFGVVLGNNVLSTERHTRERSRSINERLCKQTLSEAVGVVYGNRYYLAVDGVCYVADSRYKYTRKDDIDGSYNYEWWYFDNMPVRVWAVLENKLCFGCEDGRVCVFDDEYTDRIHLRTQAGDLGYGENSASVTYNERIRDEFAVGDTLKILSSNVYAQYLGTDGCEVEDGCVVASSEAIVGVYEGTEVYADGVGDSGLEAGVKYTVCDVDIGRCTFGLMKEDGEVVYLISGDFRLHRLISGLELKIKEKDDEHFKLWREGFGDIIVSRYNDGALPTEAICKITHKQNITASWYSAILDLGTNMAAKTILGITVAAAPDYGGRVSFGFESKCALGEWALKGAREFSFEDLSFDDFSFDTRFMSSYTVRLNRRNVNYVIFRFTSDDDKGCAVHNFKVLYKINKNNIGVV